MTDRRYEDERWQWVADGEPEAPKEPVRLRFTFRGGGLVVDLPDIALYEPAES